MSRARASGSRSWPAKAIHSPCKLVKQLYNLTLNGGDDRCRIKFCLCSVCSVHNTNCSAGLIVTMTFNYISLSSYFLLMLIGESVIVAGARIHSANFDQ